MEKVATQPTFEEFRPAEIQVPLSKPESGKGFPFEFELGRRMVQDLGSSTKGFKDPTTQTSTLKSVEVVAQVMKANKVTGLFQTMAIMSLNMGNLTMGGKHSKEQIGYGGEGKGSVTRGIG